MMLNASIMTVEKPGRASAGDNLPLERPLGAEHAAQCHERLARRSEWRRCGRFVVGVGAVAGDCGAAGEAVGIEIDRDDDAGAESARRRHRHRIDQRAVDQPAAAESHRRKYSGQRIGGAHRKRQRAARQPDFVAGADLGRDRRETDRQILDGRRADRLRSAVGPAGRRRSARSCRSCMSR